MVASVVWLKNLWWFHSDRLQTTPLDAVVINQRFATMHFAGEDPIGRRIRLTQDPSLRTPTGAPPAWLTIVGVAPGAFAVGRLLASLLVQTSTTDPLTLISIAALMTAVSIAACVWPARRAARLDPLAALRCE